MSNGTSTTVTTNNQDGSFTFTGKDAKGKEFSKTTEIDPKSFFGLLDPTRIGAWEKGYTQDTLDRYQAMRDASLGQRFPGDVAGSYVGSDPSDPENGDRQKKEEETSIEAVKLAAGTSFDPSGWQLIPAPYVPYTPPAAQDWSAWMFDSPFGGGGGLAYQPGSQEYLTRFIPENVWGSRSGLSQGVLAELAPSTRGLLSEALPSYGGSVSDTGGVSAPSTNVTPKSQADWVARAKQLGWAPGQYSSAAYQGYLNNLGASAAGDYETDYGADDWDAYVERHPDILKNYQEEWKKKGVSLADYGKMHYTEYGKKEGRL